MGALIETLGRDTLPLIVKSFEFPLLGRNIPRLEWMIKRRYGQYFEVSVCPTSSGRFTSSNARCLFQKFFEQLPYFSREKEYSHTWCFGQEGVYPRSSVYVHFGTRLTWLLERSLGHLFCCSRFHDVRLLGWRWADMCWAFSNRAIATASKRPVYHYFL